MIRFEMIFVILAGIFLGTLILNENTTNMSTSETLIDSQLGLNAVSVANSFVEQISSPSLAYDEYLLSNPPAPTPADSLARLPLLTTLLGHEAGETAQSLYDDVDDFDPALAVVVTKPRWFKQVTLTVCDTVPGSTLHYFQFNGQKAEVRKQFLVSYFKFLK
jgi:hypothetical protein